ncbi:MAG TPA: hypothetical protein DEA97_18145 [Bacteroidales bacterium]|nr:MAG: hypothetical protein UR43_C0009G0006 [candidate division TM6 bacterium GW2011_GWF2_33_332]OFY79212.1 MAG: hypothetical protein A2281_14710 [Bacteroidetes bacterium RIFOXYA12_FULL_38_20]HBS88486.1 hypothetical protein [Bacteroidales bacterium]
MLTQEEIYKLLQEENWSKLIDIFHKNKEQILFDALLKQSLEVTICELVKIAVTLESSKEFVDNLERLLMLDSGMKKIGLSDQQREAIIVAIVNGKRDNLAYAYQYAKKYPENDICQKVIIDFEKNLPVNIEHSQMGELMVEINPDIDLQSDHRKTLFNSYQEVEFFLALKRVFDSYQIYPNVGLSSIIDINKIKEKLDQKEIEYFFKSSVDFAVFEPFKNYIPIYFFEIDSVYHDTEEQIVKDRIKSKIFSLSGQKLYRIRKNIDSVDEEEFEKLIRDIRKSIDK